MLWHQSGFALIQTYNAGDAPVNATRSDAEGRGAPAGHLPAWASAAIKRV